MPGCKRTNQNFWSGDEFIVTSSGIRDREERVAEIVARGRQRAKPGNWGCVQAREFWPMKEETHMRPRHNWLMKFGNVPGRMSCVEKE